MHGGTKNLEPITQRKEQHQNKIKQLLSYFERSSKGQKSSQITLTNAKHGK